MTLILNHPKVKSHLQQIWKFMIAGGTGAVIDFSLLNFFTWFFGLDPRVANIFSTLVASTVVFLINKFFAFRHREGKATTQAARFVVAYAIAYVLNVVFTALFITAGFRFFPHLPHAAVSNLSKALAIGVVMFWNYFLLHSFVFRQKKQPEEVMTTGV
ncbi:MAG TPA: GtrA family protein [Candidatus Peribacteraceae bacterium]|nr:GtrA family protein [Candidatus Peribacteraceae bacterium]